MQEEGTINNTCVVLNGDGSLDVVEKQLELSAMAPGSVLLQLVLAEVCGTDVHLKHRRLDTVPYPIILAMLPLVECTPSLVPSPTSKALRFDE